MVQFLLGFSLEGCFFEVLLNLVASKTLAHLEVSGSLCQQDDQSSVHYARRGSPLRVL